MFNAVGINNLSELDEDDDNAITIITKGSHNKSPNNSQRIDYIDDDFDLLDQTLSDNEEAVINESIIEKDESKKQTESVVVANDKSEKEEIPEKSKNLCSKKVKGKKVCCMFY